ncbi:MAG: hypothetical protein J6J23_02700 [Clostridia bacterium]|nr:hypothetical protein [Clostridia bacterium]
MEKKTIATTISGILILIFIIITGATLSAFKVQKEKVEVKSIRVQGESGILVTDKKGNEIVELEIKSSAVGVRPATGEEDSITHVPSTINDSVGTEGAYASFFIKSEKDFQIVLISCELTEGYEENIENVRIALLDDESDSIKGSDVGHILGVGKATQKDKITIAVWLDADTNKSIASGDINIVLGVVYK